MGPHPARTASVPARFGDVTRVVDLTRAIGPDIPVPMGFPAVSMTRFLSREEGDVATVEILTASLHSGTHVDAPAHMLDGGGTIDELPALALCGPAVVIDVPTPGGWLAVEDHHVLEFERRWQRRIEPGNAVLLRTGHGRYWDDRVKFMTLGWPYLSSSAIDVLLDRGVRALGVESADPDRVDQADLASATFECHRRLLGAGVSIIENLANLDQLTQSEVELMALVIPIARGSGAPARVLALLTS